MARLGFVFGLICVLSLTALIAGCGSGGGSSGNSGGGEETTSSSGYGVREETTTTSTGAAGAVLGTIPVQETEFSLTPDRIALDRPGTYVFRAENDGSTTHALTIEKNAEQGNDQGSEEGEGTEGEEGEEEQSTQNLNPGETADLEVDLEPGTYQLYCPVDNHEERGMTATVTVQGS